MNCWRNVALADKFDMSPEDAGKKVKELIVEIVRDRQDRGTNFSAILAIPAIIWNRTSTPNASSPVI